MPVNGYGSYTVGQVYPAMNYGGGYSASSIPSQTFVVPQQTQQYMISVDGEGAAKAWQIPGGQTPNLIIPLWDLDGKHVYFKTTDAYGRMNPLKKGVIVFEDETIPQTSGTSMDTQSYVTKEDFEAFKTEMRTLLTPQNNQNGSRNNNRGENR